MCLVFLEGAMIMWKPLENIENCRKQKETLREKNHRKPREIKNKVQHTDPTQPSKSPCVATKLSLLLSAA